ncbi:MULTISPECIES: molybdate ABC transporter substrate-binding protein [Nocardiopsis]|uniref:Molybdate ABC transporter substrate-binding protein n=1 Tax=Nocardiopsis sinuspersici TaxID=501010 RepID=A0A1V3C049_9ACTN|nr:MULTISPECIES: molybdate ABC transporter substrate-binding protein [Nocardiopsis]OOC54181.1 molybdate ABC transporter substrate-binding protein [Nocardiopsis sinuspersici]
MPDRAPRRLALGGPGPVRALAAGALALTALTACSAGEGTGRQLNVFAAASLTDVFTDLAEEFEDRHPRTEVVLNFAGSSDLAVQINSGAPADVFAAADTATMDRVVEGEGLDADWSAEHGERGVVFATNTLRIAVPPGNPAGIGELADLAGEGATVAFCAEEVPCGAATAEALGEAGLEITPDTYEENVRAVLTKVELGEVDAGLVYATDVASAGERVEGVEFAEAGAAVNEYPVGVVSTTSDAGLAADWVELVRSGTGAKALDEAGFSAVGVEGHSSAHEQT